MPYKDAARSREYNRQWYLNNRGNILKRAKKTHIMITPFKKGSILKNTEKITH